VFSHVGFFCLLRFGKAPAAGSEEQTRIRSTIMFTALANALTPFLADVYYYWGGGGLGLVLLIVVIVLLLRR
jgi:hypothetical protein